MDTQGHQGQEIWDFRFVCAGSPFLYAFMSAGLGQKQPVICTIRSLEVVLGSNSRLGVKVDNGRDEVVAMRYEMRVFLNEAVKEENRTVLCRGHVVSANQNAGS